MLSFKLFVWCVYELLCAVVWFVVCAVLQVRVWALMRVSVCLCVLYCVMSYGVFFVVCLCLCVFVRCG